MSTGNYERIDFEDPEALASEVAQRWLAELNGRAMVALSGGRIAKNFFINVAKQASEPLKQVEFFWADDRCVPPDDPESNFALANTNLFEPASIDSARVHRIEGELEPPAAAERAESELRRVANVSEGETPVLDWVFLGMGEDGHVASLFPGEDESVCQSDALFRPVVASKPPPNRITLSYQAIAAAKQVWVLASGVGKAEILRASLAQEVSTPLARVLAQRERTLVFSATG